MKLCKVLKIFLFLFIFRSFCYKDQDICDLLCVSLDISEIKIYYGLNIKTDKYDDVMTL